MLLNMTSTPWTAQILLLVPQEINHTEFTTTILEIGTFAISFTECLIVKLIRVICLILDQHHVKTVSGVALMI